MRAGVPESYPLKRASKPEQERCEQFLAVANARNADGLAANSRIYKWVPGCSPGADGRFEVVLEMPTQVASLPMDLSLSYPTQWISRYHTFSTLPYLTLK